MALEKQLEKFLEQAAKKIDKDKSIPDKTPWEIRRYVYDAAVRMKWDRKVDRPFVENANTAQLHAAMQIAKSLVKNPGQVVKLIEQSKSYRQGAE